MVTNDRISACWVNSREQCTHIAHYSNPVEFLSTSVVQKKTSDHCPASSLLASSTRKHFGGRQTGDRETPSSELLRSTCEASETGTQD